MKKILAIIMSAMVAASMLPMMAFATEGDKQKAQAVRLLPIAILIYMTPTMGN